VTPEEYRKVLWQGLGRGVLLARTHPHMSEYRDVILDACLHCRVYDFMFEGTRSEYMLNVIAELPDRKDFERAVIESLAEPGGGRDKLQRHWFARALALDGNAEALSAMYRQFPLETDEISSLAEVIVSADGVRGLQFVIERVFALKEPDVIDPFLDEATELLGSETVERSILDAGLVRPEREAKPAVSREEHPFRFARNATDEELPAAAEKMLAAISGGDWKKVQWYLRVFGDRPYPLNLGPLLKLVGAEELNLSALAINALKHFTDPAVREIGCGRKDVNLIAANFQAGDHRMVLDWYLTEQDYDLAHHMESDLINLWKRHPQPETEVEMLLAIYEKSACSICRERAVERLIELESLPPGVREECRWDASEEIRKLVH
jgi:hypothetical protein